MLLLHCGVLDVTSDCGSIAAAQTGGICLDNFQAKALRCRLPDSLLKKKIYGVALQIKGKGRSACSCVKWVVSGLMRT